MDNVSVIIPAYNEAENITHTLTALRDLPRLGEVVVVDDGSNDNTAQIAEAEGVRIISMSTNKGKGAAMSQGLAEAKEKYVCFLDADLRETAALAAVLYQPVLDGKTDVAIASFPPPKSRAGFGAVTGLARYGLRLFTGTDFQSPLSGQRAMHRQVAEFLAPFAAGFGVEVAFTIDAHRAGYRILEVPVAMTHRETGRDWHGFYHRGRQCGHVARVLGGKMLQRGGRLG